MRRRREKAGLGRVIVAGAIGVLAAVWSWTAPGDPGRWTPAPGDPGVELSLLDNGFHTDLAVPRAPLEARGGPLAEAVRSLPAGDWVLIGWGDARFYVDQSPMTERLPDGARAFFKPGNASVIMLDPAQQDPRARYAPDSRRTFRVSEAGFDALARHVEASLDLRDGAARMTVIRQGDDARFFASREHFWIGHLCNHWTAGALNAAGLPVRPLRSVTSAEVMAAVARAELDTTDARD
jgi:hypothetical protein